MMLAVCVLCVLRAVKQERVEWARHCSNTP